MKSAVFLVLGLAWLSLPLGVGAAHPGDEVVVIYNKNLPDSKSVADYYAQRRQVPGRQVWGLNLPSTESMTRSEYEHQLAQPLLRKLRDTKLFVYPRHSEDGPHATNEVPTEARIRYAVLCYGVPLKIANNPNLQEEGIDRIRPELKRNDAAVDSELALLPIVSPKPPLYGVVPNRFYGATNAALMNPTQGLLLVARLDGPSPAIARGLVDKAIQAEADGLWGRAYFDARGITNGNYALGDEWIRGAAQVTRKLGFETILDDEPSTFSASFPMSQIAFYAGWYDTDVSGPFTRPAVEFMPGAFAYHLHSFSAETIRSPSSHWVGPLLAKGATATMGCVEEPYLEGTPDVRTFLVRWIYFGFSFGEAAYSCQNALSWQTTVVGDPLYRPFGRTAFAEHEDLLRRKSKMIEWSQLRVVDMNLAAGMPIPKVMEYLRMIPQTPNSAVLLEKMGDLHFLKANFAEAADNYRKAIAQGPTPQQRVRLTLALARMLDFDGKEKEEFAVYRQFVKDFPDYPDLLQIYQRLVPLAERFGTPEDKEHYEREINRLAPSAAATKP